MCSITWSRRWPGNDTIGTRVIYSESEEATASASMLGIPMISLDYNINILSVHHINVEKGRQVKTRRLVDENNISITINSYCIGPCIMD